MVEKALISSVMLDSGEKMEAVWWLETSRFSGVVDLKIQILHGEIPVFLFTESSCKKDEEIQPQCFHILLAGYASIFNKFDATVVKEFVQTTPVSVEGLLSEIKSLINLYKNDYSPEEFLLFVLTKAHRARNGYANFQLYVDDTDFPLALEHAEKFSNKSVSSVWDLETFLDPIDYSFGDESFLLMKSVGKKLNYDSKFSIPGFRDLVRRLCSVIKMDDAENCSTVLREIELIPDAELEYDFGYKKKYYSDPCQKLPLKSSIYREYLFDLPVSSIATILKSDYSFVKPSMAAKGAIELTNKYLSSVADEIDTTVLVHEAYCAGFARRLSSKEKERNTVRYSELLALMYEMKSRISTFQALKAHFEKSSEKMPWDEIESVILLVIQSDRIQKWLKTPAQADQAVNSIFSALGENTVEVIQLVADSDAVFSAAQWAKIVDNYENLKDTPISWWGNMI